MKKIDSEKNIIVNNKDFFLMLKQYFGNEYSLGIHGIDNADCWIQVDGIWQLDTNKVNKIKNSILEEGLNIKGNRKILSTVRFENFEEYLTPGSYSAGGVIVALPKFLKSIDGEKIYIGSPIEKKGNFDRNYDVNSLSEIVLPDYFENSSNLDSMYILAEYEKINDNQVQISFNRKHIYFNDGLLPKDYFESKKKQIMEIYNCYNDKFADNLNNLLCQKYNKLLSKEELPPFDKIIIKTARQFLNEKKGKHR